MTGTMALGHIAKYMMLSDGRQMSYRMYGDPMGLPLVALHGTPGSRLKFKSADSIAKVLGIKLICPDRWAYAETTAPARPSLSAYADDIRQLVDELGIEQFSLLGVSGGGPFAVAVASKLPERVIKLGLFAPVGPIAGSSAFRTKVVPQYVFHKFCFGPLSRWPVLVSVIFHVYRSILMFAPSFAITLASLRAPRADKLILAEQENRKSLATAFLVGLMGGSRGPAIDLSLFGMQWDISLGRVSLPARMWLGTTDRNVPRSAATALASQLPRCTLEEIPNAGHFWILENEAEILSWFRANEKQ